MKGHEMNICVGNLPGDITAGDLREMFGWFGCVENAHVMRRGRSDGTRFRGLSRAVLLP
jgi:hypothetical protein